IEIAKRIEEGLRHMIQAISACPTTIQDILDLAEKVEKDESRIDEVVDGVLDPNAKDDFDPKKAEAPEEEEAIEEEMTEEEERAAHRRDGEVRSHPPPLRQDEARAGSQGIEGQGLPARARPHRQRADDDPL